jgi:hypothetical protein
MAWLLWTADPMFASLLLGLNSAVFTACRKRKAGERGVVQALLSGGHEDWWGCAWWHATG